MARDRTDPAAIPHAGPDLHDAGLPAPEALTSPRQGSADQCGDGDEFAGAARGEHR